MLDNKGTNNFSEIGKFFKEDDATSEQNPKDKIRRELSDKLSDIVVLIVSK